MNQVVNVILDVDKVHTSPQPVPELRTRHTFVPTNMFNRGHSLFTGEVGVHNNNLIRGGVHCFNDND